MENKTANTEQEKKIAQQFEDAAEAGERGDQDEGTKTEEEDMMSDGGDD